MGAFRPLCLDCRGPGGVGSCLDTWTVMVIVMKIMVVVKMRQEASGEDDVSGEDDEDNASGQDDEDDVTSNSKKS